MPSLYNKKTNTLLGEVSEADVQQLNLVAVLVAALSSFMLGGLWYSKALFGPTWQRLAGDARKMGEGHPAKVFGLSFVFALVAALWLIDGGYHTLQLLIYGLILGLWR